jgi:hypothetical protein
MLLTDLRSNNTAMWLRFSLSELAKITGQCVLTCGIVESLDAARLRDVVYYSSAGFSYLQAREVEHVPIQHGSLVRAQDWCGFGVSGSRTLALTNTRPEWEAIGRLWRFAVIIRFDPAPSALLSAPPLESLNRAGRSSWTPGSYVNRFQRL